MTIDYQPYLQRSFRSVVKQVLQDVSKNGLQGESYFFISFQTNRDDVKLPPYVKAKYPEQISIVLQHQFENLIVSENGFSVDIAFGGVPTTISVPFTALIQFADPAADFGLSFQPTQPIHDDETIKNEAPSAQIINLEALRKK